MISGDDNLMDDAEVSDFPDVEAFVEGYGLREKYRCTVFKYDTESGDWAMCEQFVARAPKAEEVVQKNGTGRFMWKFNFDEPDPVTKRRKKPLEYQMVIKGQKWEDLHDDWKHQQQAAKMARYKQHLEKVRAENMMMGGLGGVGADPDKAEEKIVKQLAMLRSLMPAQMAPGESMLPLVLKMMTDSSERSQVESRNMMTMFMNMQAQTTQMMMSLLTNRPVGPDPMAMFNNIATMFQKTMEIKTDMNPAEPDRLQTILEFAKEVLPAAFNMLGRMPASVRKQVVEPMVNGNPNFTALKDNPELLAQALNEWDRIYTPEKVDELLEAANLQRPASTFGNYEKYAAGGGEGHAAPGDDAEHVQEGAPVEGA